MGRDGDPSRSLPNVAGLDVTLISSGGTSENVYGSKRESIVFPTTFTAESDCPAICGDGVRGHSEGWDRAIHRRLAW